MHTNAPIGEVVISPLNPRRLDVNALSPAEEAKIAELALAIQQLGVLEPGIGRRVNGHIELLVGQRRLIAARRVGLEKFPVDVRDMSDEAALLTAMSEQVQRDDLPPLDEAEAYRKLLLDYELTDEEIAAHVGKSVAYVKRRLALLALSDRAAKALASGAIGVEQALAIARVPSLKVQDDLLDRAIPGDESLVGGWTGPALDAYMLDRIARPLSKAPWTLEDATLVPKVGACEGCPKNTATAPDLFSDAKGEPHCTDPDCYARKADAFVALTIKQDGRKALSKKDAAGIFDYAGFVKPGSGYVALDQPCTATTPSSPAYGKKWRTVLRKELPKDAVVIAAAPDGTVRELLPERVAKAALRKAVPSEAVNAPERRRSKPAAPAAEPDDPGKRASEQIEAELGPELLAAVLRQVQLAGTNERVIGAIKVVAELAAFATSHPMPAQVRDVLGRDDWCDLSERARKYEAGPALALLVAALMVPVVDEDGAASSRLGTLCKLYGVKPKEVREKLRARVLNDLADNLQGRS